MKKLCMLLLLAAGFSARGQDGTENANAVGITRDSVGAFVKVDQMAYYPGGVEAWKNYLMKEINPDRATSDVPRGTKKFSQTAMVQFIVCTDGTVCNIKVVNDVLPSVRREAEAAIRNSGAWVPAVQNGRKVKAYQKQPITFVVQ